MKIILIGNYLPDKQESMIRFANLLDEEFKKAGIASEVWTPIALFGSRSQSTSVGLGKWLGYIDKYILFPFILGLKSKRLKNEEVRFHICDHSNAPYLKYLPANHSGITCHDVIAIRGGLGYGDLHQSPSRFGKIQQRWILSHLSRARYIAFVSKLTLKQFEELVDLKRPDQTYKVIYNSFNADFRPIRKKEALVILEKFGINLSTPFLLHVGSGLPRKNRSLLLNMIQSSSEGMSLKVCFAGERLDNELVNYARQLNIESRVISIVKPDHETLVALYSACYAFIFPSFSEGFGWPVIEAQACGAPVIASNIEPMPEVSGGGALHADPNNPEEFIKALAQLEHETDRKQLINKGFENGLRFDKQQMIRQYLDLYHIN
ncbi:MAG TPA: glycosyltransferase family 1 protein [Pedobacter sp.]|jgi:glycosyltransferase involved in cell wall biosynthesis